MAADAYAEAGLGPDDLDVAECQDTDAARELLAYEELGLCEAGACGDLLDSGAVAMGGRLPVNPSGGLLSKGEPLGASAIGQVVELVGQLQGRNGPRRSKARGSAWPRPSAEAPTPASPSSPADPPIEAAPGFGVITPNVTAASGDAPAPEHQLAARVPPAGRERCQFRRPAALRRVRRCGARALTRAGATFAHERHMNAHGSGCCRAAVVARSRASATNAAVAAG